MAIAGMAMRNGNFFMMGSPFNIFVLIISQKIKIAISLYQNCGSYLANDCNFDINVRCGILYESASPNKTGFITLSMGKLA